MRPWVVMVLAGCYAAQPPEGAPCGEGRRCPHGQTCSLLDNRCYNDPPEGIDGSMTMPDTPIMTTCTPRRLLSGGTDPATQGWQVLRSGSYSMTASNGITTMMTTNNSSQLLVLRDAFPPNRWGIEVVMQVVQSGGHASNNAAIAIMPSFHDPVGDDPDRAHMLFVDQDRVGFGGTSIGMNTTAAMMTYRLERTPAGGIKYTFDGGEVGAGTFTSNGTIAIGDQTTAMGLDSTFRLASVDLFCP